MTISTKPPAGTRDFLPDDIRRREYVIGVIREIYDAYGFEPLETPAYENIETLLGKYGDEGNKLIFKILKRGEHEASGEADLALRYDLTVPLARIVAHYQNQLPKFFKRYQIQPVWRADRPARGRFREFYQCDIDAVGSTSQVVEAELLAAVGDVMVRLGFQDFYVRLNHRRTLTALLEAAGVPAAQHADTLVAIDKLDKIGVDGVERELRERGVASEAAAACLRSFDVRSSAGSTVEASFARLRELLDGRPDGLQGVSELEEIVRLTARTPAQGRLRIDPSLARGLSYYTGAIMEIATPDSPGSLGAGGRYDNLIGMFLDRNVPACGVSLGLERIIVLMTERKMFSVAAIDRPIDVMMTIWNDEGREDVLALAASLRRERLRVEVYPDTDKLGKQFKYAAGRQVRFVAVIGDDERATNMVTIKDMSSGEQKTLGRDEVASHVRGRQS